jgi:hypothetical protein
MDIESLTTINEVTYRAFLMLIQGITLIVGLASVMFMLIAIVCAVCDRLREMGQFAHLQIKRASEARAHEPTRVLPSTDCALDRSASSGEALSLH